MNDDPISERAIRASSQHRQDMRALELGLGGTRLMEALAAAQAELPAVIEAKKKGARGKYAPLEDLLRDIKPILLKHKLMMRQGQERSHGADDGGTKTRIYPVFTDIIHWPSGEMHRTTIDVPCPKMDPQGIGGAITYGKRYSLLAALALATTDDPLDDDGFAARKRELSVDASDSPELAQLKAQIDGIKDITKLLSFQVGAAGNKLDEGEFAILREHWKARRETLQSNDETLI